MEKNGSESAFPEHTAKMMNEIFLFLFALLNISGDIDTDLCEASSWGLYLHIWKLLCT